MVSRENERALGCSGPGSTEAVSGTWPRRDAFVGDLPQTQPTPHQQPPVSSPERRLDRPSHVPAKDRVP
jgi:hypothetical protein